MTVSSFPPSRERTTRSVFRGAFKPIPLSYNQSHRTLATSQGLRVNNILIGRNDTTAVELARNSATVTA